MSHRCPRLLAALAAVVYLSTPGSAQPRDIPSIKGGVRSNSPVNFRDYRIELRALNHFGDIYRSDLAFDGEFELRNIPSGDYLLLLTSLQGAVVQQEVVTVNPSTAHVEIHLTQPAKPASAPGTVSVTQLRNPPDRKAMQAFTAAQRFSAAGSTEKAAGELEKAIRISPEFAEAYTNLAVQHIRMHRYQDAIDESLRAIRIAGPNAMMLSNLAFAQIYLGRVEEALGSARAALRLDSGAAEAHMILGSILFGDPRTRAEAIPHLERAAESIPSARALLERAQQAMSAPKFQ